MAILENPTALPPKSVSALRRLRLVSTPEAISFLLLLVASVLKRTTEFNAVPVLGAVHGALVVLYLMFWADAWNRVRWPLGRAVLYFVLAMLPAGGFFAEKQLRNEEEAGVNSARARKEQSTEAAEA